MPKDKIVVRKQEVTSLSLVEQEIALEAKQDVAMYQQGTARISLKSGIIAIDGQPVKDNKLVVAVVAAVFGKAYYLGDFDPDVPQTPVCYAFHPTDPAKMVPHEAAPDKQNPTCLGCPHNKFGTATRGSGKRCKDELRLMVVAPSEQGYQGAEVRLLTVPPGSLGNWGKYVAQLAAMGGTFRSVFTEIGIEPYKGAYRVTFHPAGKLPEQAYLALKARRDMVTDQAMQPYPVVEAEEEKPRRPAKSGKKLD